mmetsp:Transcript_49464/g.115674  ORF Transcript_49464/g.115674 Transcript_49464/m.115674 type:complete len:506 (-) Transcript_49464:226-1743(-)
MSLGYKLLEAEGGYNGAPSGPVRSMGDDRSRPSGGLEALMAFLDRKFCVAERKSTVQRELRAGLVTWVTMSYIVVVNPMILSAASGTEGAPISFHSACRATCISAAVSTAFVGLVANLPFGLAAGMGLNSYFRYGVVSRLGLSPEAGLACVFTQAVIFAGLAMSGLADTMQDMVPMSLKCAITVAIGIFQAFVGFQLMGLVVRSETTLVALGDLLQPTLWLSLAATLLVAVLLVRKTKGALLVGIAFTAIAAHALQLPSATMVVEETKAQAASGGGTSPWMYDLDFSPLSEQPDAFGSALLCFLFIVMFDTAGVQHGIGQQAGLLDESGRLPGAKYAYVASAIGTALGALMGTSPVIIHNESAAGVQEGGRTGLCALTTAVLFFASPMLVPVIELIPPEATAPCLVLVGVMMMVPVRDVDFTDLRVALPSFLIICVTPMTFSISAGIFCGLASYWLLGLILKFSALSEEVGERLGAWLQKRDHVGGLDNGFIMTTEDGTALPNLA